MQALFDRSGPNGSQQRRVRYTPIESGPLASRRFLYLAAGHGSLFARLDRALFLGCNSVPLES
jgi:hypothetical protein